MTKKATHENVLQTVNNAEKTESANSWSEDSLLGKGLQLRAIVEAFDGLIYLASEDYRIEFMNAQHIPLGIE